MATHNVRRDFGHASAAAAASSPGGRGGLRPGRCRQAPHNKKGNRENRIMFMQEDLLQSNGGSSGQSPQTLALGEAASGGPRSFYRWFRGSGLSRIREPITLDGWLDVLPNAALRWHLPSSDAGGALACSSATAFRWRKASGSGRSIINGSCISTGRVNSR